MAVFMQDPDCQRQTSVQNVLNSIAVLRPTSLARALGASHQAWQWLQGLGHCPPPQFRRPRQCLPRALLTSWVTSQRAGGPPLFLMQVAAQSSPSCWLSWSSPTEYERDEQMS